MTRRIANAPCSRGVESANEPRKPPSTRLLDHGRAAGHGGIEPGPIGFNGTDAT
jgi:inosose dehydratase